MTFDTTRCAARWNKADNIELHLLDPGTCGERVTNYAALLYIRRWFGVFRVTSAEVLTESTLSD